MTESRVVVAETMPICVDDGTEIVFGVEVTTGRFLAVNHILSSETPVAMNSRALRKNVHGSMMGLRASLEQCGVINCL